MEVRSSINSIYELERMTWSGGHDTVIAAMEAGKGDELYSWLDDYIDELYVGVPTEMEVNDLLWFERDMIFAELGIED